MLPSEPAVERVGRVAVLIPVYNEPGCMGATLRSLCGQGIPFTLVLVDDGSNPPLAVDVAPLDYPVVLLRMPKNGGIEAALNAGLEYISRAGFELVARVDAGDRCAPNRLARQQAFLDANPNVHLVGSNVEWRRDDDSLAFDMSLPSTHEEISRALHHKVCLLHPTVMFRASLVSAVGPYSYNYPAAEDYEFFWRIARRFQVANIPETLHTQRFHAGSISIRNRRRQLRTKLRIQLEYFRVTEPLSFVGVAKTLALMSVPYSGVVALKGALSRRRQVAS
ncbi:MAG TPA: glycosyltransferase [Gemmatimonadaceae bacterium]|nr:glycosyltransferase [Gemmatimonadaceae bacterium]